MPTVTTTFRLDEAMQERIARLQKALYDEQSGLVRPVTASDVMRLALDRLHEAYFPEGGRKKKKEAK